MMTIRIGTRASALALAQTGIISAQIEKLSGQPVEIVPITTHGDTSRESLATIGGTGVFASALRESLLNDECELVVHSLKDLPTGKVAGLRIGSFPRRADARDTLISKDALKLSELAIGSSVGTGSPRRAAQLRSVRGDLNVQDIRGNVDTRIEKVTSGDLDAVILAAAGLERLARLDAVSQFFELSEWPTAPGQGALAIEVRTSVSNELDAILRRLDHGPSRLSVLAERAVLAKLEAGCAAPIGASAVIDSDLLLLTATVYQPDGSQQLTSSHGAVLEGSASEREGIAIELGTRLAAELLENGAAEIAPLK